MKPLLVTGSRAGLFRSLGMLVSAPRTSTMRAARIPIVLFALTILVCCFLEQLAAGAQSKAREIMPSDEAKSLHARGREAGSGGDHAEALRLLIKASELAPDWPQPVYDRGFTHLLMENFTAALADYRKTLELSPRGFFTAHVAVDTLLREEQGEFPAGFYLAYTMLEFMQESERRSVIPQLVEKFPRFAPAWLEFAKLADTLQERLKRIESGLAAKPDAETFGMLRLNQALTLQQVGQAATAEAIIRELANDPKSTTAVEAWAKATLTKTRK